MFKPHCWQGVSIICSKKTLNYARLYADNFFQISAKICVKQEGNYWEINWIIPISPNWNITSWDVENFPQSIVPALRKVAYWNSWKAVQQRLRRKQEKHNFLLVCSMLAQLWRHLSKRFWLRSFHKRFWLRWFHKRFWLRWFHKRFWLRWFHKRLVTKAVRYAVKCGLYADSEI